MTMADASSPMSESPAGTAPPLLRVRGLQKNFADHAVLRGIEIFKMTTLASAVAYVELLQQGKLLASLNFNPIETYTVIAVVFFLCLFPLVQATYALERRLGRSDA